MGTGTAAASVQSLSPVAISVAWHPPATRRIMDRVDARRSGKVQVSQGGGAQTGVMPLPVRRIPAPLLRQYACGEGNTGNLPE